MRNSSSVYWASWINRSAPSHSSSTASDTESSESGAWYLIRVKMVDEDGAFDRSVIGLLVADQAEAGPEVEDDRRLARALQRDARGVAAIALIGLTWARARAPNSVERDLQHPPSYRS